MVWSAFTFINHVPVKNGKSCLFRVVRVSGTIRKAEEEAVRRAKSLILAAKSQGAGATESSFLSSLRSDAVAIVEDDDDDEDGDGDDSDGMLLDSSEDSGTEYSNDND
jgi:ribonuclease P/MRP protein subunit POP5